MLSKRPSLVLSTNIQKDPFDNNNILIALMGVTGSGKSSFINMASSTEELTVGNGLQSCTSTIDVSPPFTVDGRSVVLIDTPGFDDTTRTDADILSQIAVFLAEMYRGEKKLAGIIYLHRISDVRMGGISARSFRMFRKLCGEASLKNIVIATTRWSEISHEVGKSREEELKTNELFFKPVLDRGARIVRYDNNRNSALSILRDMVKNEPLPLLIQTEVVDERKNLAQTTAGAEVDHEITALIRRHEQEMEVVRRDLQEATRKKEHEVRKEAAAAMKQLQSELDLYKTDLRKLWDDYPTHQRRFVQKEKKEVRVARQNVKVLVRTVEKNPTPETRQELTIAIRRLQQLEAKQSFFSFGCVIM